MHMKKRTLIAILGIWVAIIPSLGLPSTWKHWVIVISGLFITAVALKRKYIVIEESADGTDATFTGSEEPMKNSAKASISGTVTKTANMATIEAIGANSEVVNSKLPPSNKVSRVKELMKDTPEEK